MFDSPITLQAVWSLDGEELLVVDPVLSVTATGGMDTITVYNSHYHYSTKDCVEFYGKYPDGFTIRTVRE